MPASTAAAAPPRRNRPAFYELMTVFMLLCLVAMVVTLIIVGYTLGTRHNIKPGAIVQTTFSGNPAMLMVALTGPNGENRAKISDQDQVNVARCEPPGGIGTRSSWMSNGGVNWPSSNPELCASASQNWFASFTCHADNDCRSVTHLPCGPDVEGWNPSADQPWIAQCGGDSENAITSCTDRGVCYITDPGFSATCDDGGTCRVRAYDATCPMLTCTSASDCYDGQTCEDGYCNGEPTPHILINAMWRAEGYVTAVNDDDTANVLWQRVQLLYPGEGPRAGWFYNSACKFIHDEADNAYNQTTANILFGYGGSWTNATATDAVLDDITGFADYTSAAPYSDASVSLDSLLPTLITGGTHSAWNLTSKKIALNSLTRVLTFSIMNNDATDGSLLGLYASLSSFS